jgi:hypothetical protein
MAEHLDRGEELVQVHVEDGAAHPPKGGFVWAWHEDGILMLWPAYE